jgi:hypothetical protein
MLPYWIRVAYDLEQVANFGGFLKFIYPKYYKHLAYVLAHKMGFTFEFFGGKCILN